MDETADSGRALMAFVACTGLWMVAVGLITAGLLFAMVPDLDLAHPETAFTPATMGLSATLQATGMGAMVLLLGHWMGPDRSRPSVQPRWWIGAALAGLGVGLLPSWIAVVLSHYLPGGALDALATVLDQDGPGRLVLIFAICVAAPIGEELAFRGFLWHHLARVLPPHWVWIFTSVLFAAYHLDPIQAPALLPTALFLGWLRWSSGSVVPAMVGHFTNNVFAMAVMLGLLRLPPASPWTAAAGTLFTVCTCAATWWWTQRR